MESEYVPAGQGVGAALLPMAAMKVPAGAEMQVVARRDGEYVPYGQGVGLLLPGSPT